MIATVASPIPVVVLSHQIDQVPLQDFRTPACTVTERPFKVRVGDDQAVRIARPKDRRIEKGAQRPLVGRQDMLEFHRLRRPMGKAGLASQRHQRSKRQLCVLPARPDARIVDDIGVVRDVLMPLDEEPRIDLPQALKAAIELEHLAQCAGICQESAKGPEATLIEAPSDIEAEIGVVGLLGCVLQQFGVAPERHPGVGGRDVGGGQAMASKRGAYRLVQPLQLVQGRFEEKGTNGRLAMHLANSLTAHIRLPDCAEANFDRASAGPIHKG